MSMWEMWWTFIGLVVFMGALNTTSKLNEIALKLEEIHKEPKQRN